MDLMEYKAKELFESGGVPVQSFVHITARELEEKGDGILIEAARRIGYPAVVKAQVMTGGRGKAGGIRFAENDGELVKCAHDIIGMDIKGHKVRSIMIVGKAEVMREFYLSVMLDRITKCPMIIFSPSGGVDIEETAKSTPENILKTPVMPLSADMKGGVAPYHTSYIAGKISERYPDIPKTFQKELGDILNALYGLFIKNDCMLCEINPLALCKDESAENGMRLIALDGKVSIDDSAVKRQAWLADYASSMPRHPLTKEAELFNFLYIPCDGNGDIAVMSNGSGMLMSCIDMITREHIYVRAVLDLGGGATAERIKEAVRIILSDEDTHFLFINIFGGITRCDEVAGGIKLAYESGRLTKPVIIRFEGTNKAKGLDIISGIPGVAYADGLIEGVAKLKEEAASYEHIDR